MASKKTAEATGMELTVATKPHEAIEKLNERIAGLKHIQDSVYVTSGKITMATGQKDIKEETDIDKLVTALSSVVARAEQKEKAYELIGITSFPVVKVDGSTVEEWIKDVKLRIDIINQKETFDKLVAMKKRWEELMTNEDKKALLIAEMENL